MRFFKNYLNHKVKSLLERYKFKSEILEIGCGTGETLELLRNNYDAEGIDLSGKAIRICLSKGLSAKKQNFLKNKKKYNSIICLDVLEHIESDLKFIEHINNSLKKNGKLLVLVPSGKMMKDDIKYGHYRRYSKKEIIKKLEEWGLKIEHVEMFGYPFLYFLRILANHLTSAEISQDENLNENTKKSSYESPFDGVLGKTADFLNNNSLILDLLLTQNLFSNQNKGLGVLVVAKKLL